MTSHRTAALASRPAPAAPSSAGSVAPPSTEPVDPPHLPKVPATDAARFLAAVPRLAGFTPRESLVLVPDACGTRLGTLRVDLPQTMDAVPAVAATAIGMVCRLQDADGVVAVVYADAAFGTAEGAGADAPSVRHRELLRQVGVRAPACGLRIRAAYIVASDGWGAAGDGAPRPLSAIATPDGTDPDQCAGTELPHATKGERRRVAAILGDLERIFRTRLHAARHHAPGSGTRDVEPGEPGEGPLALAELPEAFEDALSWDADDLHPAEAGLLALAFELPLLRDVVLTQWSSDLDAGLETLSWQLAWRPDEEPAERPPGPLRLAGDGPRPEAWRLRQGLALARHVAACAPRRSQPGTLASAAWLSWALGNSTHATEYLCRARAVDPRHGLVTILDALLTAGRLPGWAFAP